MSSVAPLHRSLEQELFALLRGASLECLVCGEFVLQRAQDISCPECGARVAPAEAAAGSGLQFETQAG